MRYTVFTNTKQGRTVIDTWTTEDNKTLSDLAVIYDGEFVKVDEYTNEGHFVTSVYLAPNDEDEMEVTPAKGTVLVGIKVPSDARQWDDVGAKL